jgi:hypothetical protein
MTEKRIIIFGVSMISLSVILLIIGILENAN